MPMGDYNDLMSQYKQLAGTTDKNKMRQRTSLARQIQRLRKAPAAQQGNGAGVGAPPNIGAAAAPAAAPAAAESPASSPWGPPPEPPKEGWSTWAPSTQMPSQQQLSEIYAKAYDSQLKDLSYGVDAKQQQAARSREQYLADRGISVDSAAYRNDQQAMADARAAEDAQLRAQAANFAQTRADSEFNRALQTAGFELDQEKFRSSERNAQADRENQRWLAKFDAGTQERLLGIQLDSEDRRFMLGLEQDDRQFIATLSEQVASRTQDDRQFQQTMKFQIKELKQRDRQWKEEFLRQVRQDKAINQLQKDQLAELIRSNKANEAIARFAASKSASGQNPDDVYNLGIARTQAAIDVLVSNGMSREKAVEVVSGIYQGAGGVSYL